MTLRLFGALLALLAAAVTPGLASGTGAAGTAGRTIDLELVLAVDVSMSMDAEELALQKQGYVEAFRSREVIEAILRTGRGRMAVTYMEWAGTSHARFAVPWTMIDSKAGAESFAKSLESIVPSRVDRTSISSALAAAAGAFVENAWIGERKVIDVSGDGPNNEGAPLPAIRDQLVAAGVTINGLALMVKPGSQNFGVDNLDEFYVHCVTGGAGSFVLPVRDWKQFGRAIKLKLLQEITGLGIPPGAEIAPAQFKLRNAPAYDCRIGEKIWEKFIRTYGFGNH